MVITLFAFESEVLWWV